MVNKSYSITPGCPIAICEYRGSKCDTTFFIDKCFYNSAAYKKDIKVIKKWF